jgi:hypothetical protein
MNNLVFKSDGPFLEKVEADTQGRLPKRCPFVSRQINESGNHVRLFRKVLPNIYPEAERIYAPNDGCQCPKSKEQAVTDRIYSGTAGV